ncbi:MAG: ACP S-malonyltransferase [Methylophilaceae bacterium]
MKTALFFPGQGSQSVGMMAGFEGIAIIKETFNEASDLLGVDFWPMVTEENIALNQTENTQPLMLAAGVAVWRVYQIMKGVMPTFMAGHSLGEYTALVAAGAISYADAIPLVRYRAQAMQNAVPEGVGAMAAILGLEDDVVRNVCDESAKGEVVAPVNLNSPGQIVIAGNRAAVERAMMMAKEKGAKRALQLPVSVPSHCSLMKPAADQLAEYLKSVEIKTPEVPVIHNADVVSYNEPEKIKDALVRQLYSPVRWSDTVKLIHKLQIGKTAECGPGKVLAGLTKRITADLPCTALVNIEAVAEYNS